MVPSEKTRILLFALGMLVDDLLVILETGDDTVVVDFL